MESRFITQSKEDFARSLMINGSTTRSQEIAELDDYEPVFKKRLTHEQAEPCVKDYNEMVNESYIDINALIVGFRDAGRDFQNLMLSTDARLKSIKRQLMIEKEKLEDLNILCNQYSDFNTVVTLDNTQLFGNYSYDNGVIGCAVNSHEPINYSIVNVDGNGYEGNGYVYKNNKFLKDSLDTSNRRFINDNSNMTIYEYSRITASNSEKEVFQYVNFDSIEAKQTITITSQSEFNKIKIQLSSKDTFLTAVSTSEDGISYKNILKAPIELNNDSLKYDKINYIANSGMLCFPSTKYLKVSLASNGVTDDVIAFEKTIIVEEKKEEKVLQEEPARFTMRVNTLSPIKQEMYDQMNKQKSERMAHIPIEEQYIYNRTRQTLLQQTFQ